MQGGGKMPANRKETMDIREILRRLQKGQSARAIAEALDVNRKTVARYRVWAERQGLLESPLPSLNDLQHLLDETLGTPRPPQNISTVEPYRQKVVQLREDGVEIAAIHQRLQEQGYIGSYASVYRFVRSLEPLEPDPPTRKETAPGEDAQVDFGYAGKMIDPETGKLHKTWAFVMLLSWSRHQYVEFVFDQKVGTWLRLHRNAFNYFGAVPRRIVPDNLKAAIIRACWHEPEAQQSYRECAEHYDFLIAPCRPRTPEHKGKVEKGGVHYVKRNFLGGREPTAITQANQDVLKWCNTTAGLRIHGTTRERPLDRFEIEKKALQPLPGSPYDMAVWKRVKIHRDCYITFDNAYYSTPFRLVGQQVWVRGGTREVQIYTDDYKLVATHTRAVLPGQRQTHLDHLPPHKIPGLTITRDTCRQRAAQIGPSTLEVVNCFLNHRPEDRLRTAGRLLGLADRFGRQRLEAACSRAVRFDDLSYMTIKRILEQGLDAEELPLIEPPPPAWAFVRSAGELVGRLTGDLSWK
jgi:transposase